MRLIPQSKGHRSGHLGRSETPSVPVGSVLNFTVRLTRSSVVLPVPADSLCPWLSGPWECISLRQVHGSLAAPRLRASLS